MWNYQTAYSYDYELLKENARKNRRQMTLAESVLWQELRGNGLGVKFLRQHIIGNYIVDFVCKQNGLVVEVDGEYHNTPEQQALDEQRSDYLMQQGFHVVRFTNDEVLYDTERVLDEIIAQLD
ncbi:MAG: endonuclease domain-containing protein [Bacteroidaceae bacterium]|nr:endonuclease domain-containing protein [Bacteroidaceae bacterium]